MKNILVFERLKRIFNFQKMMFFWFRHYKVLFFCCFLVVLGYGGLSWYSLLYNYHWDEAKKKAFLEENFKETTFKEDKFRDLVTRLLSRETSHRENVELQRDFFKDKNLR